MVSTLSSNRGWMGAAGLAVFAMLAGLTRVSSLVSPSSAQVSVRESSTTAGAATALRPGEVGPAAHLVGRALGETPMMEDLRDLCDGIGGRPTGSPACQRAVAWAEERFKASGFTDVVKESFTLPNLWLPETAEASCLTPVAFPIPIAAASGTPSTLGGQPVEARLVNARDGSAESFARLGAEARGAVALVMHPEMKTLEDLFVEYLQNPDLVEGARKSGVTALLIQSTRPRELLYRHPMTLGPLTTVPAAIVGREQAFRLARLLEKGAVRVRVAIANRTGGPYESQNVIAEIKGREKPEEIVLLGAHLDSWDLGTGAEDNGVNAALVLDVARGFKETGLVPRRTVRFVLFTGEEQGLWGSAGYAVKHAGEMAKHRAVVIFDIGSGRTSGFYLNGRADLRNAVEESLAAVAGLGASDNKIDAVDGTDNFDFMLYGVPTLLADQDPVPYLPDYHAQSDVFERVNAREAKANAALASALVWGLADRPGPLPGQQTRAQVEQLIKDNHLEEQMKAFGQWEAWAAGARGLPK